MAAPTPEVLAEACGVLSTKDSALAQAYAQHGLPEWRSAEATYVTLARTVAYQQISLSAAGAIWQRTLDYFGGEEGVSPKSVLSAEEEEIRACGMSRPKVSHMRSIAKAMERGGLDLKRVLAASPEDARKELLAVKGIGPWTAEIFLLYSGDLNAFPTGDIGLMNAYQMLCGDEARLNKAAFSKVAQSWRPYRGVATHLLWAHFHAVKHA